MGSKHPIAFSSPFSPSKSENETPTYRNYDNKENFKDFIETGIETLQELYFHLIRKFKDRDCLGKRRGEESSFCFRSYEDCFESAKLLGSTIKKMFLHSKVHDEQFGIKLDVVGVFSKNREEWVILDIACCFYNITLVPIHETIDNESIEYIIKETKMTTLFCSKQHLNKIFELNSGIPLETIVSFDSLDKETEEKLLDKGFEYCLFNDLINNGSENFYKLPKILPNDVFTISYTSGTEKKPRGVLITHRNMISAISNLTSYHLNLNENDTYLSYLPLSHIFERFFIVFCLFSGARIGFYNGEVMKLKMDIFELKPTVFTSVPKIYSKFNRSFLEQIDKLKGLKKKIMVNALSKKLGLLEKGEDPTCFLWDTVCSPNIKKILGTKFKFMVSGAAPLDPILARNITAFFCCPLIDAYGLTESTGAAFASSMNQINSGSGPGYNVEFKILSENLLGYAVTDKNPRGELMLRGPTITMGYFKNLEQNKNAFEKDGWLHTGDIVELNKELGTIKIIDRKKNIFKLASGEYISPVKIEKVYSNCNPICEIAVLAESGNEFLVGIVSVKAEWAENKLRENESLQDFVERSETKNLIVSEMKDIAKKEKLFPYEEVKRIIVLSESFMTKGFTTNTFKLKRNELKRFYDFSEENSNSSKSSVRRSYL